MRDSPFIPSRLAPLCELAQPKPASRWPTYGLRLPDDRKQWAWCCRALSGLVVALVQVPVVNAKPGLVRADGYPVNADLDPCCRTMPVCRGQPAIHACRHGQAQRTPDRWCARFSAGTPPWRACASTVPNLVFCTIVRPLTSADRSTPGELTRSNPGAGRPSLSASQSRWLAFNARASSIVPARTIFSAPERRPRPRW